MMCRIFIVVLLVGYCSAVLAGDIQAGKAKSASCAGCHGPQGVANIPGYPHLAAQKASYLVSTLGAYRRGDRESPIMGPIAKSLSDEDVRYIAAFYASQDRCE
jgi:cytochrome c553